MLSRVAAVMAPCAHNRRRVTGSSGRRREGRESEPPRPSISRRVFASALLLLVVVMMCCGTGGAAAADVEEPSSDPKFQWKGISEGEGVTVESLGVPGLLKVGSDVFAVAEAQCKNGEGEDNTFTGIASELLTDPTDKKTVEVLNEAKKDTQFLEEGAPAKKKKVDVSRPTTVVKGTDIYMLAGKYSRTAAAKDAQGRGAGDSGLLLVKGTVSEGDSDINKKIQWNVNQRLVDTLVKREQDSLMQLVAGGGSGVKMEDGTLVFPVEVTKKGESENDGETKSVSLLIYTSDTSDDSSWKLSKGMSADGCGEPSVVEWREGKLMMMTACDDGRRRVYESGDKGESWTEALGTLSRVWGNKHEEQTKRVASGFITATLGDDNKKVVLVTLPVYSKEKGSENKVKSELHLWLTDNTRIVDIGPVSREDDEDVAASSVLYNSGENTNEKKDEKLIALYEKKKGDGKKPSPAMVSVLLTEQLQRVKEVLTTWKKVDETVSNLCPSLIAEEDRSTGDVCSADKITDGLVGFLSGNFSDNTWRDEYLGVNATVKKKGGAEKAKDGVNFRGAWAEWPVGSQGENQLYQFANYNFTLVATVSIEGVPQEGTTIPLMGVKTSGDGNPVLLGLSYDNNEKKWILLCDGRENKGLSIKWQPGKTHQVAIVLQNEKQGSAYVDGKPVGNEECALENKGFKRDLTLLHWRGWRQRRGPRRLFRDRVQRIALQPPVEFRRDWRPQPE
ncbi:trans-sialidase, putative [Trypanosoma cruzi]|nr:trans-sialidase, putative [Trypanosoma cruzi]